MAQEDTEELAGTIGTGPAVRARRTRIVPPPLRLLDRDLEERVRPGVLNRERVLRRMLVVADAVTALLAVTIVVGVVGDDRVRVALAAAVPVVVLINKVAGLYDRDHLVLRRSTLDELPLLFQLSGLGAFVVTLLGPALIDGSFAREQAVALWAVSFALIVSGRVGARRLARVVTAPERCLLIGEDADLARLRDKIAASGAHAEVVTTLPWDEGARRVRLGELEAMIERRGIHRVVIAPLTADAELLVDLIRAGKAAGARVSVLPRILQAVGSSMEFETLDGLTVLGVPPFGLSRSSQFLKRAFDVAGATMLLIAIAPAMLAIAAAIRLDSRGPVLFRQTRVGREGRRFAIYKFRTMAPDAEARKAALIAHNEAGDGLFKIAEDPRVTRVGRVLRRTSLDELPQLLNVLRGEMSLVGPRPLVVDEDARVLGLDRSRLHLDPGMTGPWQVLGSARIPMNEMLVIDYLYVSNWSLWADVKILLRTVDHVFAGRNR